MNKTKVLKMIGVLSFVIGNLLALFLWDWRWALAGVVVFVGAAATDVFTDNDKK